MNDATTSAPRAAAPWHFWTISGISLLWNAFGAYLYSMSNLGDKSLMAGAPPEMQAYVANMPIWAHTGWAFGVWGSLVGSLLLLARSRHAGSAFAVSLAGALVSYAAQAMAGVLEPAQPIMILVVIVFLWWYSRKQVAAGILR